MNRNRRKLMSAAAAVPAAAWLPAWGQANPGTAPQRGDKLVLSRCLQDRVYVIDNGGWRGFSDRVMGGISTARLDSDRIDGRHCIRLTGNVTRESNGGFIQMALYFGRNYEEFDGSDYRGIELLVYGNDENYNLHVRTSDCGWYDQSYRATFFARPEWQRIRIPWADLAGNAIDAPLDTARLQRIAILGWMREFEADIALAEIALYA